MSIKKTLRTLALCAVIFVGCYPPKKVDLGDPFGYVAKSFVQEAQAEPKKAIAHLGIAQYANVARDNHPVGFGAVVFVDTFGDAYKPIVTLVKTKRATFIEYNLAWKDGHNFSRADFPAIIKKAQRFSQIALDHPYVDCYFSGATEHNLNKVDAQLLADQVLAVIPRMCQYVNNPWVGKGAFIPTNDRILNEVHGIHATRPNIGGRYIVSWDGDDSFDFDTSEYYARFPDAEILADWTSQNNGKRNRNDTTPRPQRKYWPTGRLIQAQAFHFTVKGKTIKGKNNTFKPKSDQHFVPPAPRELKPVFISPTKANQVKAVMMNGQVLAVSEHKQSFADGRNRYYFSAMYGYEYAQKALQMSGSPLVKLMGNGQHLATVNFGFRE